MKNIYELLVNTAGKQVTLKVNSKPGLEGARDVVVTPIADESELYYHDWVQENIKKVSRRDRRQGRLPPRAGHAGDRPQRVRQALLPAAAQEGAHHRRARQRRRQRVAAC